MATTVKEALIQAFRDEARARNHGINPDMPGTIEGAHGERWRNNGPYHDTREGHPKRDIESIHGEWWPSDKK